MSRILIIWKFLVPCSITVFIFWVETCVQLFVFKSGTSSVLFIVKLMLGGFVSDMLMAVWIKPSILNLQADDYQYNLRVSSWIEQHINIKFIQIILMGLAYTIVISCPITLSGLGNTLSNVQADRNLLYAFILGLIVAPIVETCLNQFAVIEAVNFLTKRATGYDYTIFSGIVSALIFALMHNYSHLYTVYAALIGLYLSFSYIYTRNRYKSKLKGLLCTFLLHSLINLFPFCSMVLDKVS